MARPERRLPKFASDLALGSPPSIAYCRSRVSHCVAVPLRLPVELRLAHPPAEHDRGRAVVRGATHPSPPTCKGHAEQLCPRMVPRVSFASVSRDNASLKHEISATPYVKPKRSEQAASSRSRDWRNGAGSSSAERRQLTRSRFPSCSRFLPCAPRTPAGSIVS